MSAQRAKGTLAETALVKFLIANGFPGAERRALHGTEDKGDITGTPCLAWEVKNVRQYAIPTWMKETEVERINARADFGLLVVKPNRIGVDSVGQWWCITPIEQQVRLLREAGYGDPL